MIYHTDQPSSREMCEAVHKGTGWPLKHVREYEDGPAVVYGILRGCLEIIRKAPQFWYIDHGYLLRDRYYRIVENAHQHSGMRGTFPSDRWEQLGIEIKPWKTEGEYYLVCPPSKYIRAMYGCEGWLERIKESYSPIKVRSKYSETTLVKDLQRAKALITFNSNAAVEALCEGVPVIVDAGPCRVFQNREILMRQLAYGQWTMDEIEEGLPWKS